MNTQFRHTSSQWQHLKAIFASFFLLIGLVPSLPTPTTAQSISNELEFNGTISALPSTANFLGDWTVGGRTVRVAATTVINTEKSPIAIGAYIEVKGTPNSDRTISATKIEVKLPPSTTSRGEVSFTGNVEELPSTRGRIGDWKVGARTVHVSATTVIQPEAGAVAVGVTVKVEGLLQSDGSINAVKIEIQSNTTPDTRILGKVEELPDTRGRIGAWKVSGRVVHVTADTRLKLTNGEVAIGVTVKVVGVTQADRSLLALEIETVAPPQPEPTEVAFRGTVESLPNTENQIGAWKISGRTVHVTRTTRLITLYGAAQVGSRVAVEGVVQTDRSVTAIKLVVGSPEPDRDTPGYRRFFGIIKVLPETRGLLGVWNVGGIRLNVVAATALGNELAAFAVGVTVEVTAVVKADGIPEAVKIEVKTRDSSQGGYIKFLGTILRLPDTENFVGEWAVRGAQVFVTRATKLNQEQDKIALRAFVEVEGNRRSDGGIDATSITVKKDADTGDGGIAFVRFYDTIKSLPATRGFLGDWTVGNKTIHVYARTQIEPDRTQAAVGALAEIKGYVKDDGSIDAVRIAIKDAPTGDTGATFVELVGTITALPDTRNFIGDWKLDNRIVVRVSRTTDLHREHASLAVGVVVEVKGASQADGSIDAVSLELKRSSNFTTINRLTSLNAGGYQEESTAAGLIAAFGSKLATKTQIATTLPLPTSLADVTVLVDGKPAPLFFVSPTQINYQVPENTALGTAKVEVIRDNQVVAQGALSLSDPAPSLFTANADGKGSPSGYVTRVRANNTQVNESLVRYDHTQQKFVPAPLLRQAGETLYLVLWGTGFSAAPNSDGNTANGVAENVEVTIGGVKAQVDYAGRSGYVGVEQLNIRLSENAVTGESLTLLVKVNDGQGNLIRANEVTIAIQ